MRRLTMLRWFGGVLIGALASPLWAGSGQQWHFDVYLDDRLIGHHHFEKTRAGPITTIESRARFEVSIWFIPAYRYEHTNVEQWANGCLRRIDAVTDDNGERYVVAGQRREDQFVIRTQADTRELDSCVRSFAYWDKDKLRAPRLLNAQTGEYVAVRLEPLGTETLQLGTRQVLSERYRLSGEDLRIDLWYSKDNDWLALETTAEGGRRLLYRKQVN